MKRDLVQGVEFSHQLFAEHLSEGGLIVDATCGNGGDTRFLAELVGPSGKVLAFDIQQEALDRTGEKLGDLLKRVRLVHDDHQYLDRYLDGQIDGILFNLGYLPGGDKEIKTGAETTLLALKKALKFLRRGGLAVLVIYTGHPGGEDELTALINYIKTLDDKIYNTARYSFLNQKRVPPQVLVIKKRG